MAYERWALAHAAWQMELSGSGGLTGLPVLCWRARLKLRVRAVAIAAVVAPAGWIFTNNIDDVPEGALHDVLAEHTHKEGEEGDGGAGAGRAAASPARSQVR